MATVTELDDATFADRIAHGVVLVDFWGTWCPPCKLQGEIVQQVADQIGDRARIVKVNVEKSPRLAARFAIRAIPTILIFKDAHPVGQFIGLTSAADLVQAIEEAH